MTVSNLKYNDNLFHVVAEKESPSQAETPIVVSVVADVPYGVIESDLFLTTDDAGVPEKYIKLRGFVRPRVEITPARVSLGAISDSRGEPQTVQLLSPYQELLQLDRVENPLGGLLHVVTSQPTRDGPIEITLTATKTDQEPGVISETLWLHVLVGDDTQKLRLPIYGMVSSD